MTVLERIAGPTTLTLLVRMGRVSAVVTGPADRAGVIVARACGATWEAFGLLSEEWCACHLAHLEQQ